MHQLALFDAPLSPAARPKFDPTSLALLQRFRAERLAERAHPRSVQREISQIRSLAREAGADGCPRPLAQLIEDLPCVARVLTEPVSAIARSTGRSRLIAIQRFLRIIGHALGHDVRRDLASLDALLPAQRGVGWHTSGTLVAGRPSRRRQLAPVLSWSDLEELVEATKRLEPTRLATRNQALVALHCFTGLRPEEIVRLRWEDIHRVTPDDLDAPARLCAAVTRAGRSWSLPTVGPAGDALVELASDPPHSNDVWTGALFRGRGSASKPLSYRAARSIIAAACEQAELPIVGAVD